VLPSKNKLSMNFFSIGCKLFYRLNYHTNSAILKISSSNPWYFLKSANHQESKRISYGSWHFPPASRHDENTYLQAKLITASGHSCKDILTTCTIKLLCLDIVWIGLLPGIIFLAANPSEQLWYKFFICVCFTGSLNRYSAFQVVYSQVTTYITPTLDQ
jgi:hypothetical protein